jgi:hypothetical protein
MPCGKAEMEKRDDPAFVLVGELLLSLRLSPKGVGTAEIGIREG